MDTHYLLVALSIVTLVLIVAVGGWQLMRVRRSQRARGETPGGVAGPSP